MRFLTLIIWMVCLPVMAANPPYTAFDTNSFTVDPLNAKISINKTNWPPGVSNAVPGGISGMLQVNSNGVFAGVSAAAPLSVSGGSLVITGAVANAIQAQHATNADWATEATNAFSYYPPIDFSKISSLVQVSNIDQRQGIALDKRNYDVYITYNNNILKYNSAGVLTASNLVTFGTLTSPALQIMEDCDFYNGFLVVPHQIYASGINSTNIVNATISLFDTNLNLVSSVGISNTTYQVSSLVDDPDLGVLFACNEYDPTKIYEFNDTNFAFIKTLPLNPSVFPPIPERISLQGMAYNRGILYLQINVSEAAQILLVDPITGTNVFAASLESQAAIKQTFNEFEGCDFNGTNFLQLMNDNGNPSTNAAQYYVYRMPKPMAMDKFSKTRISDLAAHNVSVSGKIMSDLGYPAPINDGLILDLPFSEAPGSSTAFDHSKNGYILYNPVAGFSFPNQTNGISGYGLNFDKTQNQELSLPDTNVFNGLTNLTLSVWVQPIGNNGGIILSKDLSGPAQEFWIYANPTTNVEFMTVNTNLSVVALSVPVANLYDGNWHNIVGTYNSQAAGTNMFLYFDGKLIGGAAQTGVLNSIPWQFEVAAYGQGAFFNGNIDEVMVWNRALTFYEVVNQFNRYATNPISVDGTLIASRKDVTNIISASSISDSQLSTNVALLNGNNTFSNANTNTFNGLNIFSNIHMSPFPGAGNNSTIDFGMNFGRAALILYRGGTGLNFGWGLNPAEMQFFSQFNGRFTFNTGGDLNATGVNELMRLDSSANVLKLNVNLYARTNTAPLATASASIVLNTPFNAPGQRVGLHVSGLFTDAGGGQPILVVSNFTAGLVWTNSIPGALTGATVPFSFDYPYWSSNDLGVVADKSSGTGASVSISGSTWIKQ
jgi:hypothetical protein